MVLSSSLLKVCDNSGVRVINCIKILGKKTSGNLGDLIIGSVRRYNPKKKLKKGDIICGILIRNKKIFRRFNNIFINFSTNSIILLNKRLLPIGTRIYGPVISEFRDLQCLRLVSLSIFFV